MSEEKSSVYAVCQNVRMKMLTSYKTEKKKMQKVLKRKLYKSEGFSSDILTIQYLCGLTDFFILTILLTLKLTEITGGRKEMTAKEYLRQIGVLDAKINRRQKQVDELKALATSAGSLSVEKDRVQSSPSGDRTANYIIKWVDMEHEVTGMIDELIDLKDRIIGEIHQLDDERYIRILEMRYIDQETFEQIAVTLHMDIRHIFRLHGYALQEFTQKILS